MCALEYVSTWVGASPGATYTAQVTVVGPSRRDGFFEAWNHEIGALRNYRFDKTVRITILKSGAVLSGDDMRHLVDEMRGEQHSS